MLRPHLLPDEGVIIGHCNNIHTCFCRFPIDATFLDSQGTILKIVPNLRPWRIPAIVWKAHEVLETNAGFCQQHGLEPGQTLTLQPNNPNSH